MGVFDTVVDSAVRATIDPKITVLRERVAEYQRKIEKHHHNSGGFCTCDYWGGYEQGLRFALAMLESR